MRINEQYRFYQLVNQLIDKENYHILHFNPQVNEIWLEKKIEKKTRIVHMVQRQFDWQNHLKKHIAQVIYKIRTLKPNASEKNLEVFNLYIATHPPVDEWEFLKKPMPIQKRSKHFPLQSYYLDIKDLKEYHRLEQDLDLRLGEVDQSLTEEEIDAYIDTSKRKARKIQREREERIKAVFSHGKPRITYVLILLNILMFVMLEMQGGSTSMDALIAMGAKYNPLIMDGEWYRIITSMFLHIGFIHLFMNMLALYYLGAAIERIYGSFRFLIIYMLSGIGGGVASFAFMPAVSAGASGAVFGLFGALLYFGLIHRRIFNETMGPSIMLILAINIIFGFLVTQIDMGAHLGGLIFGFFAGAIVNLPNKKQMFRQTSTLLLTIASLIGLFLFGMENNEQQQAYYYHQIEMSLENENYSDVVRHATQGLDLEGDMDAALLFQRSFAYIQQGQTEEAIKDLEKLITITDDMPEAYYNLALLYERKGQDAFAREMIDIALEMRPDAEGFQQLHDRLHME